MYIIWYCYMTVVGSVLCTLLCSELELEAWPVSSSTTQLAYKNVYCAMCHGLNPAAMVNLTETFHSQIHTDIASVDWWVGKVVCELESITDYLKDRPDQTKLIQLIQRCTISILQP